MQEDLSCFARESQCSSVTLFSLRAQARASGVDFYFHGGNTTSFNFRRVDHSSCPDEPPMPPPLS